MGAHFFGHSNVCPGLREEEPEARTPTLQPAVKEVAKLNLTELDVGISIPIECFLSSASFLLFASSILYILLLPFSVLQKLAPIPDCSMCVQKACIQVSSLLQANRWAKKLTHSFLKFRKSLNEVEADTAVWMFGATKINCNTTNSSVIDHQTPVHKCYGINI